MNKTEIRLWCNLKNQCSLYLDQFNFDTFDVQTGSPMTIKQRLIVRDSKFGDISSHLWKFV